MFLFKTICTLKLIIWFNNDFVTFYHWAMIKVLNPEKMAQ